jgi:type VI secretion system Hcp family effector
MACYIKFDGVDGESKDKDHQTWVDLQSASLSSRTEASGQTGASRKRGTVVMDDVHCTKLLDKATPKIFEACVNGKVFPKVEIHFCHSYSDAAKGRQPYMLIELKDVYVTSFQGSGVGGESGQIPMESFSLNYEEIRFTYNELDRAGKAKGSTEMTWKVEEGQA